MVPMDDEAVVYDPVAGEVHVLNATARVVWDGCAAGLDEHELVQVLCAATGAEGDEVAVGVATCLEQFRAAGLVGADEWRLIDRPHQQLNGGQFASATYAVLADGVVFRSDDRTLCEAVDRLLGPLAAPVLVTVEFDLTTTADGHVTMVGAGLYLQWGSVEGMLEALPTSLNQVASVSSTVLALHAGAVVAPGGTVMVLPATSGSGKSTLTAALVQAGWSYLSDEAAGVRPGSLEVLPYAKPLVLDAASCLALGLPVRPSANVAVDEVRPDAVPRVSGAAVGIVVLPTYVAGAEVELTRLVPIDAFTAIAEHALNLRYVGHGGLEALAGMSRHLPVYRLIHGGGPAVVQALAQLTS